jgi:hypothetical protein
MQEHSTPKRDSLWRWVHHEGQRLENIGIREDGSLHNPNGYPEEFVRAAVLSAEARRHTRRSRAAAKAAETRRRRVEQKVYRVAGNLRLGHRYGPAQHCYICEKALGDPDSVARGIGSECWQHVLAALESQPPPQPKHCPLCDSPIHGNETFHPACADELRRFDAAQWSAP